MEGTIYPSEPVYPHTTMFSHIRDYSETIWPDPMEIFCLLKSLVL